MINFQLTQLNYFTHYQKKIVFLLMDDNENNIYITKIENIFANNLKENSNDLNSYSKQSTIKLRDNLYGSYDVLMNEKYKIEINQKHP